MICKVAIQNNQLGLRLKEGQKIIDELAFEINQNLSDLLLIKIDALLSKNKLNPENIKKYTLQSDIKENYTTYRIAKAVVNTLNWRNS